MKIKAPRLVTLILAVAVLGQTLFVRATDTHRVDGDDQPAARIARFETLLESLRQDLLIPLQL
jgi:hypothetical protein